MRVAIIGRTEILYETIALLQHAGHEISCILTAKEAPEYTRTAEDFRNISAILKVPFAQGPRIAEHVAFLQASRSDIAVSINYTGVIPQDVIDLFPLGILNAHGGDLPRYRGNACQAWAIINGEDRIGLCIHRMIGGELDSGDIVARAYLPIDHNTKVTKAWGWMVEQTPLLMVDAVNKLGENSSFFIERQSKDPADALRCYPRMPEDGKIDWGCTAIEVLRLINASNRPYAGAYCDYRGERVIIWDASLVDDGEQFLAVPGQVTAINDASVDIACRRGKVRIHEVEVGGVISSPSTLLTSLRGRLK